MMQGSGMGAATGKTMAVTECTQEGFTTARHTRIRAIAVILSTVLLVPGATLFADSSPTGRTPKIFWTSARQAVWNRMRTENHPWWKQIKANADLSGTSTARYADLGQWATMAYQVTGDPVYAQKAWQEAKGNLKGTTIPDSSRNFTREHFIEFAWMYDWLYPALTSAQRQQWIDSLNYWSDLCLSQTSVSWGTRLGDSDETTGHYFGMVLWDLASAGDNPRSGTFIPNSQVGGLDQTSTSRNTMRNAVADYVKRAAGGVWIESSKYNMGTLQLLLMGADGVKTAAGEEKFPELTSFRKDVALAQMHEVSSDLRKPFQWGDNEEPRDLNRDRRTSLMAMLAGLLQDDPSVGPYANAFEAAIQSAEDPGFRWMIFGNPYAPSADFRTGLTTGHYAPGQGVMLARDTWASSGSLFGSHMASRPGVDHGVQYLNNFELYRKGEYAITHVIGYDAVEGEHHNAMLLAGLSGMQEARGPLAQEFGPGYAYQVGGTGGNRYTNGYYNPPPRFVHEWVRSLLYLPSTDQQHDTVVVFDRVNAEDPAALPKLDRYNSTDAPRVTSAPAVKQWIIHTPVSPTLSPSAITWQTTGGQTVKVNTLLPLNQNRTIYDETVTGLKGTIKSSEKKFQVRIIPATEQRWDTFLNVIQASDSATGLSNALVSSTNNGAKGVLIKRPGHNDVLAMFNATQGPDLPPSKTVNGYLETDSTLLNRLNTNRLHTTGFTVSWAAGTTTTVYLADLDPAKQWMVAVDSAVEIPLAISLQSLATVSVPGSGSHTLQVRLAGAAIDTTAPTIANVQVSSITATSALVTWTTDEAATEQVEFGTTGAYGQQTPVASSLSTSHQVLVSGLLANTVYHYRVKSTDAAGNQAVSSDATFTTQAAAVASFQEVNGQVTIEAERYDVRIPRSGQDWVTESALAGYSSTGYVHAMPNLGVNINTGYVTTSPELVYNVGFTTPGTYYVWVRGQADTTSDDSVHVGLDGVGVPTADRIGDFPATWGWLRDTMDAVPATLTITTPGLHTIHLWMRQDGLRVDQILLRLDSSATPPGGSITLPPTPPPAPLNQPPVLAPIGPRQVAEGDALQIAISGSDPDGNPLTYTASGLPAGATFSGQTFTWTPTFTDAGTYAVTFSVSDGQLTDSETVTITVTNINRAPVLAPIGARTIVAGSLLQIALSGSDPDGDALTYTATSLPTGATMAGAIFDWTPSATQTGTYSVTFAVSDGTLSASETVTITVTDAPVVPTNLITNFSVATGKAIEMDTLAVGERVYIDRTFTFTSIPSAYVGREFIRMSNEDKYHKDYSYLTFTLAAPATVYIAYDARATSVPSWLTKWTKTDEQIGTTDVPRNLYKKSFAAGQVSLGGNGSLWKITTYSTYTVFAVPNTN